MTKEQQDLTWACLPKEAREEIKETYASLESDLRYYRKKDALSNAECDRVRSIQEKKAIYHKHFGKHNLTSDTEPEEMLCVKRIDVIDAYAECACAKASYQLYSPEETKYHEQMMLLKSLFGDKCLPDKIQDTGFGGMSLTPPLHKLDVKPEQPSVQVKPKFKVGDIVRVKYIPIYEGEIGIIDEIGSRIIEYHLKGNKTLENDWFAESYLEHYTEPSNVSTNDTKDDTKDTMEEKELNLCELLRDYKGEKIYILSHGYMTVMGGIIGTIELEGTGEHGETLNLVLNYDGTHIKGTEVIAFPSRALYEKYPLDPYSAWMEWSQERKPKRWRAENGDRYYYIASNGSTMDVIEAYNGYDNERHQFNNYFRTKEEAQRAAEAVKEALKKFHEKDTEK